MTMAAGPRILHSSSGPCQQRVRLRLRNINGACRSQLHWAMCAAPACPRLRSSLLCCRCRAPPVHRTFGRRGTGARPPRPMIQLPVGHRHGVLLLEVMFAAPIGSYRIDAGRAWAGAAQLACARAVQWPPHALQPWGVVCGFPGVRHAARSPLPPLHSFRARICALLCRARLVRGARPKRMLRAWLALQTVHANKPLLRCSANGIQVT